MSYALYDTLNVNISSKELTPKEKEELVDTISKMSDSEMEATYLLLYQHHLLNNPKSVEKVPYAIKVNGTNMTYDLDSIPTDLQRILLKFCRIVNSKNQG